MNDEQGVNDVDVSEERQAREWAAVIEEHGIEPPPATASDAEQGEAGEAVDIDREEAAENLAGWLAGAAAFVFAYWAPAWRVTQEECAKLGQAWARVATKYLPASWLRYIPGGGDGPCPECEAVAVTWQVIGPRWEIPLRGEDQQPEPAAAGNAQPEAPSVEPQTDTMPEVHELEDRP